MENNNTQVELGVLKSVVSKLDSSIEKIASLNADVAKLLAVHEQRLDSIERDNEHRDVDIKEVHSRITTQIQLLSDKVDTVFQDMTTKMTTLNEKAIERYERVEAEIEDDLSAINQRITKLEQWKWWVMGIAAAAGYIINLLTKIK